MLDIILRLYYDVFNQIVLKLPWWQLWKNSLSWGWILVPFDPKAHDTCPLQDGLIFWNVMLHLQPGAVYVYQNLNFKLPVYIGDKVTGEVQAMCIKENKKRYM